MSKLLLLAAALIVILLTFSISGCTDQNSQPNENKLNEHKKSLETKNTIERQASSGTDKSSKHYKTAGKMVHTKPLSSKPASPDNEIGNKDTMKQPHQPSNKQVLETKKTIIKKTTATKQDYSIAEVSQPESIPVLVNKQNKLPDHYLPKDLVYTNVPFMFTEKSEKKKMRKEAAVALEELFAGAKHQGVSLLGVSAYRSHTTQTTLFNYYVNKDGYETARTYSAVPGTSEHETGLAIDVTGSNGKCAAQDCFGSTPEAKWLNDYAADYGFIIRYPKGKESITGYKYEPWHIRYVGKTKAKEIMKKNITLEEYNKGIPVSK